MESLEHPRIIIERLQAAGFAFGQGEYGARERLLGHCRSLITALESPLTSIQRMWWAEPARNSDIRTALDLGLFEHMRRVERAPAQRPGVTTWELAQNAGGNIAPAMIARMMRHLAAMNVVGEVGPDTFILLPFSRALADPVYRGCVMVSHDLIGPPLHHLPKYLQNTEYRYPIDQKRQPFHLAHQTQLSLHGYCEKNPLFGTALRNMSTALSIEHTAFPDPNYYPVFQRLIQQFDRFYGDILLVGVGHVRHALQKIQQMFPDHPGRLIMENVDRTMHYPADDQNFEVIDHHIFAPQPIRGARAYYCTALRSYDQADSLIILERFKQAMVPGYSILLLDEFAVPAQNASWAVTSTERVENGAVAQVEQMEKELNTTIQRAGFHLRRSYRPANGTMVLQELELSVPV